MDSETFFITLFIANSTWTVLRFSAIGLVVNKIPSGNSLYGQTDTPSSVSGGTIAWTVHLLAVQSFETG
jgi:hypothetical protein